MKLGQGPSEADFGQDPGRFVRQDGPESQDLLIPRRGDAGIDPDNAAKLVFAHDEAGIVAAMAAVFQQQPSQCYQRPATGLAGCRTGQVLFHFSA